MKFQIDDSVELIDDVLKGKIVTITGDTLRIITDDGFTISVKNTEVIKANNSLFEACLEDVEYEKHQNESQKLKKKKRKYSQILEVDLHIHHLGKHTSRMTNHEILTLQINTAKDRLSYAISHKIPKIIFIHGVGQGTLKSALLDYLKNLDFVSFYDAAYSTYGRGATEVFIYLSKVT